jgi:hypothetical protein
MTSRKRNGESGSPWRRPRARQIISPRMPLSMTFMLTVDRMTPYPPSPQEDTTTLPNHLEEERRHLPFMEKFGRDLDVFEVVLDHPLLDESTLTRMYRFTIAWHKFCCTNFGDQLSQDVDQ